MVSKQLVKGRGGTSLLEKKARETMEERGRRVQTGSYQDSIRNRLGATRDGKEERKISGRVVH